MTQNLNAVLRPPFLPTVPLPVASTVSGLTVAATNPSFIYVYACSQCDFKTTSEQTFKQHVAACFNLGVLSANALAAAAAAQGGQAVSVGGGNSIILPNNVIVSTAGAGVTGVNQGTVTVNPVTIGGAVTQAQGTAGSQTMLIDNKPMLVTGVKSAAPLVALSPSQVQQVQTVAQAAATGTSMTGTSAPTLTSPVTGLTSQPAVSQQPGQQPGTAAATATTAGAVGPTLTTQVVHKCPKCGCLAPSKNQLTQHRKKFHGKQAQVQAAQTAYTTTVTTGGVVAGGAATPVSSAAVAAAAASGKKTFSCTTCGYTTTRRDGLSQHYDSVHLKIKNHQCSLCPYAASQKGTLNRHVKLRHKKKDDLLLVAQ